MVNPWYTKKEVNEILFRIRPDKKLSIHGYYEIGNFIDKVLEKLSDHLNKYELNEQIVLNAFESILDGDLKDRCLEEIHKIANDDTLSLFLPVSRAKNFIKDLRMQYAWEYPNNIKNIARLLSAGIQYLLFEILELAVDITKDRKKIRITGEDIESVIDYDVELKKLLA
jgi:histone H3/H4